MPKARSPSKPTGLPIIHPFAAGIDIGSRFHVAACIATDLLLLFRTIFLLERVTSSYPSSTKKVHEAGRLLMTLGLVVDKNREEKWQRKPTNTLPASRDLVTSTRSASLSRT